MTAPRRLVLLSILIAPLLAPATLQAVPAQPVTPIPVRRDTSWHDPLGSLVRRMDRYLHNNEVDGVTMDWRYRVSPSEEIRQTVVCQLLAYVELQRLHPNGRLRREVVQHADFMIGRLADIRSYTPFDGMLAYS